MEFQDLIVKLLVTEDNSLENLAQIAGQDAKTFYRTANFRSADLSSENLSMYDLSQSSVASDENPIWKQVLSAGLKSSETVRMRSSVFVQIHETFSQHFYREHSLRLEQLIWLVFKYYRDDFTTALRESSLELSVRRKLESTGVEAAEVRKSYAYTFSETLRDEIRKMARENGLSSGRCISELVNFCFVHYDTQLRSPNSGLTLERALRKAALQNKLNDRYFDLKFDEAFFKVPPTSQKTNPDRDRR